MRAKKRTVVVVVASVSAVCRAQQSPQHAAESKSMTGSAGFGGLKLQPLHTPPVLSSCSRKQFQKSR